MSIIKKFFGLKVPKKYQVVASVGTPGRDIADIEPSAARPCQHLKRDQYGLCRRCGKR